MRDYEEILVPRVAQLGDHLAHACKNGNDHVVHVDLAKWISFFSYDFISIAKSTLTLTVSLGLTSWAILR
jgi:hypothetical protein